ncbi:MAG: hypothetical protein JWP12_2019 [Bacteroidetes bacterium]|nr:hypothetical protein [Bacteroidota bacterium]
MFRPAYLKKIFNASFFAAPIMGLAITAPVFFSQEHTQDYVFFKILIVCLCIFCLWQINILLLLFTGKYEKPYMRFAFSIGVMLVILVALVLMINPGSFDLMRHTPPKKISPMMPVLVMELNNIIILFIIELMLSREKEKLIRIENSELKIKNLEAQQQQLKQQVQPHFLFNSLNTLKSLINNHPEQAEEYLLRLSSFLRFNLSTNDSDLIPLDDELKMCTDYLKIQQVRFRGSLKYEIVNTLNAADYKVPVFAIQTLLENAIKHNAFTDADPLVIRISITEDKYIVVTNNLQEKDASENSTRIGLVNLSERYKLLLKKEITITKDAANFIVSLPL